MKRILSIILALALIISLVPAVFAADEAVEGTITYNIKQTSVSNTKTYDGAIIAPRETAEGTNFGKIKFTGGTYGVPTMMNILKNSEGLFAKADGNLANSETSLVTYRTIEYHSYINTSGSRVPVRKSANRYDVYVGALNGENARTDGLEVVSAGSSEVKTYTISDTIDHSVTAPFELMGKAELGTHGFLYNEGFRGTFNVGSTGQNLKEANLHKLSFAVRIKIPDDAVTGKYTVKIGSDHVNPNDGKVYSDQFASETNVYITKIDPEVGLEAKWAYNSGCYSSFTDASGNALSEEAYASDGNKLTGTYLSTNGNKVQFPNIRTFEAGAEYIVYFRINLDTTLKTLEDGTKNIGSNYYQAFHLSTIELIPVAEDVPLALASAELAYDEATRTVSVSSAKMNDDTDATGYSVTYGIDSAKGATISSTGVITPGTDDETVSVYADVTLDGKTVRATFSDIKLFGKEPGQLKYRISTDFLNDAAYEAISTLDGSALGDLRNAEMTFISWKDMYYTKSGSTLARATAETTDLAPITNILSPDTDKYEFPGRHSADNVPRLFGDGFISQFVVKRYNAEEEVTANNYEHQYKTGRPHYAIKLYIPQKGAYKLSLGNNFTPASGAVYGGSNYYTGSGASAASKGYESMTEVYFAKADYDLNYVNGQGILSGTGAEAYLVDDNKIGWYNSGLYGETQNYDGKYLVAPEAGEYFIIFTATSDSLEKNPGVFHRKITNTETGAVASYQDFQLFILSEIKLTPVSEDSDYTASFNAKESTYTTNGTATVNTYAYTDGGELIETLVTGATVTMGEKYTYTAPDKSGYNFLYWAKGASKHKIIVSFEKELNYKPAEGANYLVAVYEKEGEAETRAEFFNATESRLSEQTEPLPIIRQWQALGMQPPGSSMALTGPMENMKKLRIWKPREI